MISLVVDVASFVAKSDAHIVEEGTHCFLVIGLAELAQHASTSSESQRS